MNVTLRPLRVVDLDFIMQVENDPAVWAYSSHCDAPYTREEILEFCKHYEELDSVVGEEQLRYVIERDGISVGFLDLYDILQHHSAKIAIIIYPENERRGGIGQQVMRLAFEQLCGELQLQKLSVEVDISNTPALTFFNTVAKSYALEIILPK